MISFVKKHYFWLCPVFVTAVLLIFGFAEYTEIDDYMVNQIAYSFPFNAHSEYLSFTNELYGIIIRFLYKLIPAINWFAVLYIVSINVAYIAVLKVLSRHTKNVVITAVVLTTQVFMLCEITFTVLAFLLCAAGMLWGAEYVKEIKKKNIIHIIISTALFIMGFFFRNGQVLYCVIIVFLPLLFFLFKNKKNSLAAVALVLVLCTASSFAVKGEHKLFTSAIPEDMYFNEFQEYRGAASDGGKFDYEAHKDYLSENGISENDYNLYSSFIFADSNVFKAETLKAISEARTLEEKYVTNPLELIKELISPTTVVHCVFMYIFAFAAIVLFILYKKQRLEIFFTAGFVGAAEMYLFFRRRGVARVVNPIAVIGLFVLLYIVADVDNPFSIFKKLKKETLKRLTAVVTAGTIALSFMSFAVYTFYTSKSDVYYAEVVEKASADKDNIYVCAPYTYDTVSDKKITLLSKDTNPIYSLVGDWWTYSYYWYSVHEKLGKEQYSKEGIKILLDDDVLFVTRSEGNIPMLKQYFYEHYDLDVSVETVEQYDGVAVYDFSVKE